MPDAVAGIDRRVAADEQRRQERADQMHAIGGGVGRGIAPGELADLRSGEALEGARTGALAPAPRRRRRPLRSPRTRRACSSPSRSARSAATAAARSAAASGRAGSSVAEAAARRRRSDRRCHAAAPSRRWRRAGRRSRPLADELAPASWSSASAHISGDDVRQRPGRRRAARRAACRSAAASRRRPATARAPRDARPPDDFEDDGAQALRAGVEPEVERRRARASSGWPRAADRRRADRVARRAAGATRARGDRRPRAFSCVAPSREYGLELAAARRESRPAAPGSRRARQTRAPCP